MRYGVISDIHANLDALEAVLAHAGSLDGWVCLGDTVGYGPQPNECVARVKELCDRVLIGNHDLAAIRQLDTSWFNPIARAAAEWTQDVLLEETRSYLESLPETWSSEEWDVTLAHGSLTDPPRDYITTRREARQNFALLITQVLFIGHSHLSHYFVKDTAASSCDEEVFNGRGKVNFTPGFQYIVNCGSVGQPRDRDARAAYGVFDLDERKLDVFRVEYPIDLVRQKMIDANLPTFLSDRLYHGI